ncbi:MAG: hypothetical protein IKY97_01210 [Mailhella sp.]|nr:hypothetical protein [Mailhella sp.]
MKKLLTVLFCAMLAACAPQKMRMVDAKDDVAFVTMYRAMKPAMLERHLVDKAGNWYAPLMGTGQDDVGTILLDRLSPRFCSTELNEAGARSFREMLMPYDKLAVGPVSATLRMQEYTVRLLLAAVTDWSGDGKDDWLVTCRMVRNSAPDEPREYFLLISDTEASVLQPYVLMERQHRYGSVVVLRDNSLSNYLAPSMVEIEQGEAAVTQAPTKHGHEFEKSGLKSSSLSN